MANIKLVRIDFRLIHGQIVNKWVKITRSNRIIVIDDTLASNDFMKSIYIMAAPPGVEVTVYSHNEAVENYAKDQFGNGDVLVLFKSVNEAVACYNEGFTYSELQIGGLGAGPGRVIAFGPITLDKKDTDELRTLHDRGVRVYFHQVPDEQSAEFEKVVGKLKF
ncbi:PTS sugar transporter subunit IIB [uncultured Traorella sp.]|uniref:PTS sugar transporter subunit IIB n=1 Tax=uncultured Traorella sp. TaxID=1929048 RepID=UPI0025E916ED|nr:PTS sugar transporter subunit IIB [uncultured Traorella sp.]